MGWMQCPAGRPAGQPLRFTPSPMLCALCAGVLPVAPCKQSLPFPSLSLTVPLTHFSFCNPPVQARLSHFLLYGERAHSGKRRERRERRERSLPPHSRPSRCCAARRPLICQSPPTCPLAPFLPALQRRMALYHGVVALYLKFSEQQEVTFDRAIALLKERGLVQGGQLLGIVQVQPVLLEGKRAGSSAGRAVWTAHAHGGSCRLPAPCSRQEAAVNGNRRVPHLPRSPFAPPTERAAGHLAHNINARHSGWKARPGQGHAGTAPPERRATSGRCAAVLLVRRSSAGCAAAHGRRLVVPPCPTQISCRCGPCLKTQCQRARATASIQ